MSASTKFEYDGVNYEVPQEAADTEGCVIRLPDGNFVEVTSAIETFPTFIGSVAPVSASAAADRKVFSAVRA